VDNQAINTWTPITSMFLHGGWGHLIGNLLFFWVFGNNVEDSMGRVRFVVFYLLTGLIAAASHVVLSPGSPVPTVGASGAISGVLGAYLILYPHVRVRMLFWFLLFIRVFRVPAWAVLLWWFFWQVIAGLPQLMTIDREVSGRVAVWAHIGGFLAGLILAKLFVNEDLHRRRLAMTDARDAFA
jgi:membrane associated rhomboid family serine protease